MKNTSNVNKPAQVLISAASGSKTGSLLQHSDGKKTVQTSQNISKQNKAHNSKVSSSQVSAAVYSASVASNCNDYIKLAHLENKKSSIKDVEKPWILVNNKKRRSRVVIGKSATENLKTVPKFCVLGSFSRTSFQRSIVRSYHPNILTSIHRLR